MGRNYRINLEIKIYYSEGYEYYRYLWELIANSYRIIESVYIFKNFDEYCRQLRSDKQEDKKEIYWNASYYEKLIDYIKIIVAFETFNKALLLKKGYLIHKVDPKWNKKLSRKQYEGKPITIEEFHMGNYTEIDILQNKFIPKGFTDSLTTINFLHTLNLKYQDILKQDETLVFYLKEINQKRNRLHLYSDFRGAYSVSNHIQKWATIKQLCITTIKEQFEKIDEELKQFS